MKTNHLICAIVASVTTSTIFLLQGNPVHANSNTLAESLNIETIKWF